MSGANSTMTDVPQSGTAGIRKPVEIIDDQGHVTPGHEIVQISKKANDVVEWVSKNGKKSTVVFPGKSPFGQMTFAVPAGKSVDSGIAVGDEGSYKYTIIGEKGKNDPVVIVKG